MGVKTWVKSDDGSTIKSSETIKLLGFVFSERPDCLEQITNLIRKAMKRSYVICYFAAFSKGKDLIKLYLSLVRSVLEFSSVIDGPQHIREFIQLALKEIPIDDCHRS